MTAIAEHAHDGHELSFWKRWFWSTNHKDIGTLYLIFAMIAACVAGYESFMMRLELFEPGLQVFQSRHAFNAAVTAHGVPDGFLCGYAGSHRWVWQLVCADYDWCSGYGVPSFE